MEKIKVKIMGECERRDIIYALVCNGYKVWQEVVKTKTTYDDYFVCFEYEIEEQGPSPIDRLKVKT